MHLFRNTMLSIRKLTPAFWVVIGATWLNQLGNMAFVFLVLYLTKHLGYTLADASFAFAVFSAGMLIAGLWGGNLIDRVGSARIMIATLFINGLVLNIFPLMHHYLAILLLCFVWGFSFGLFRPASSTLITHLSSPGSHKITFSIYRLALNLGMSIGPALGGYLASRSFALIFMTNGIANFVASFTLLLGLSRAGWLYYRPASSSKKELSIQWLKRDAALRWFILGMIPVSMVFFQHESTMAIFLNTDLGIPLSFYGLLFTLNTLIIVFFELPLNIATLNWPYRVNFMLGSLFTTAGFAGFFFASTEWHILLLTVIWTLGEMILFPAASSYIADIAPEAHRGSYMALYSTAPNVAMLLGPWGGAILMEQYGASGLWLACGVWGLLSVIIFNYLPEPKKITASTTPS
jgi:MFS family permease